MQLDKKKVVIEKLRNDPPAKYTAQRKQTNKQKQTAFLSLAVIPTNLNESNSQIKRQKLAE